MISQAYRLSEAGLIAPFEYTSLILSVFWGIIIWNELFNLPSIIGIFLIIASGVYIAIREVQVGANQVQKEHLEECKNQKKIILSSFIFNAHINLGYPTSIISGLFQGILHFLKFFKCSIKDVTLGYPFKTSGSRILANEK